jgi:hypothetical protein
MSQFRRIYPQKESVLFDGGLNNKFERSIIADNESPDCANVIFNNGAVETRPGWSKLNTAAVGSFVGDGLYTRNARDGSETMVAFWGGSAWYLAGTSFTTIGSAQSVFTAGVRFGAAQDENYLFAGNGGVLPYKWDGTYFTRHGVYPPTTTCTVASNGVGNLTASGEYTYKVTYVNTNLVESDLGPISTTFVISTTSGQNTVSNIPTAPQSFGVSHRYLYRKGGAVTSYKRVTTIADNTTTSYNDNVADASLGATGPSDNGVPPKYNAIIYHPGQNRLFMNDTANPNYVVWTEVGQPYTVATTNFKIIGDNTSDLVKGFAIFDNSLIVFCENSITIGYMPSTTTTDWRWIVSRSPYGSKSPYAVINYQNKILFPAVQNDLLVGFAGFAGDTVEPSSSLLTVSAAGSDTKSDRIEPDIFNVQTTYLGNISSIVYKNKAYIALTYGSGNTRNNRFYTFDFSLSNLKKSQKESWVPNTGLAPAQFTIYGGNIYFQSANAVGFVYKQESSVYGDDGAAIDSYYWTKEFAGYSNEINYQKDFRYANFLVENSGAYYMNLTYRVDSDTGGGDAKQVSLDPGGSLWGTMVWGRDTWGGGTSQKEYRQFLGTARGKRIQFKFSNQNTVNQKFKVYRLNFAYNVKGYR